jgi:hypothetical protein
MKVTIGVPVEGERKIKIKIDHWDTWSMDDTLSHIIHAMLIQLKETKHGSPFVDDEDVPEAIRSTSAKPKEKGQWIDEFHHQRWEYVIDEMIWTFSQIKSGDYDSEFYYEDQSKVVENPQTFSEMTAHLTFDHGKIQEKQNRITNGCRLFGKYFQSLWN